MKKAGIILLCLQVLVLIGGFINGNLQDMFTSNALGIFEFIGFCSPAIVGVILLIKAQNKNN